MIAQVAEKTLNYQYDRNSTLAPVRFNPATLAPAKKRKPKKGSVERL